MSLIDAAAIAARLAQFTGAAVLCGGALFFLYGVLPAGRTRWPLRLIRAGASVGAIGTLGWLMAQSAQFGEGAADALDPAKVWSVAVDTGFGRVALTRLGLFLIALGFAVARGPGRRRWVALAVLGAAVSASFAWTGHGAREDGLTGAVHALSDVLHALAASTWIGALVMLAALAVIAGRASTYDARRDALTGLVRFSAIGVGVVGVLVASGLVNSWLLVGPAGLSRILTTAYGQLLLAKLALFAVMLGLAAANRYRLTPRLERALATDAGAKAMAPVIGSILTETALAFLVLGLVSWLGTLSPPVDGQM